MRFAVAAGDERALALGERGVEGALFGFVVEGEAVLRRERQIDAAAHRFGVEAQRAVEGENKIAADAFEVQRAERAGDIHLAARGFDLGALRIARKLDRAGDGRELDFPPCAVHHAHAAVHRLDLDRGAGCTHHARVAVDGRKLDPAGNVRAHDGVGVLCFDFYLLKVTGADQFPRKSHVEVLFPVVAAAVSVAEEVDAQRVAVDRADHLLALSERRGGFLLHADLRALLGGIDVHAAAAPRDIDLADVFALADAEHRAQVELFCPLLLRAEGVGRAAGVPEGVDGENAVALRQFCAECAVILPLGGHGLGRHAGGAPGVGRPTAEADGIRRIIAEIEGHGVEIGGRRCKGHFQYSRDVTGGFVQRVCAAGNDGHAL